MEGSEYKKIKRFLSNHKYPKSMSKSKLLKRNFRRKCKDFVLINRTLHYQGKSKHTLRVVKDTEVEYVLKKIHTDEAGGHLGINKTWRKVRERYYWKNSYQDVKKYIDECDMCQRKAPLKKASKPLRPIPVKSTPFLQIGMDLVGPLEKTEAGNRYIVVLTEYLTKWVDAEPIEEKTAENVTTVLTRFVANHGVPEVLITDQGREFCNQLNDKLCSQFGMQHRVASPYHPQTGGHTERYNRTLCDMLSKYVNDRQTDWDTKLSSMLFAYRTAVHASTKMSPFYLVYGRQARLPVDLDLPAEVDANESFENVLKRRCDAFVALNCNREEAAANIKKAQKTQKRNHDKRTSETDFNVGDLVLVHNTRKTTMKGGKLEKKWKGPYTVKEVLQKGTYKLEELKNAVNGSRLKLYQVREEFQGVSKDGIKKRKTTRKEAEKPRHVFFDSETDADYGAQSCFPKEDTCRSRDPSACSESDSDTIIIGEENDQGKSRDGGKKGKKANKEEEKPKHVFFDSETDGEYEAQTRLPKEDTCRSRGSSACSESDSDTIIIGEEEGVNLINFRPITGEWQRENSNKFDLTVKNEYISGRERKIKLTSEPTKVVCMRGDGNCLFRTFSFVLSGVQSFHKNVRDKIVSYMEENDDIFSRIENTPMEQYLSASNMKNLGTWGTELEIIAFSSICNTPVQVFCEAGHGQYKWLVYKPASGESSSNRTVFLQNIHGHFEPVLDVSEEVYTRTPYLKIADYVDKRLQNYVPQDILESALVNSNVDEMKMRSIEDIEPSCVITRKFTDKFCTNCRFKIDPNIFNTLCDWADFDQLMG